MLIAVATDFMPGLGDGMNNARVFFGNPSQDEERGADIMDVKQFKQAVGGLFDTSGLLIPLGEADIIAEVFDHEPFFEIDGQDIIHDSFPSMILRIDDSRSTIFVAVRR